MYGESKVGDEFASRDEDDDGDGPVMKETRKRGREMVRPAEESTAAQMEGWADVHE